jgi:hypothetical protein
MQKYLNDRYLQSEIVHRFTTRSGDEIDCLPYHLQPALRGRDPKDFPIPPSSRTVPPPKTDLFDEGTDAVGRTPRRCPEDTVPIPRITLERLKQFPTLDDFLGHGKAQATSGGLPGSGVGVRALPADTRHYAIGSQAVNNIGAMAAINAWSPAVADQNEMSIAQVWLSRGAEANHQTVEAGIMKAFWKYNNWILHFFSYYTTDNYMPGTPGDCYDLQCPAGHGFVQAPSPPGCPGCNVPNVSTAGGTQHDYLIFWQRDTIGGETFWSLYVDGSRWGGYPTRYFATSGMKPGASVVQFGGEVVDDYTPTYTPTDMGSGQPASAGLGNAAYMRNAGFVTLAGVITNATLTFSTISVPPTTSMVPNPLPVPLKPICYSIAPTTQPGWTTAFFFGGGGANGDVVPPPPPPPAMQPANSCYWD